MLLLAPKFHSSIDSLRYLDDIYCVLVTSFTAKAHVSQNQLLAQIRKATARYHRLEVAEDAGYGLDPHCVYVHGLGGMGHHAPNFGLVDEVFDPLDIFSRYLVPAWILILKKASGNLPEAFFHDFQPTLNHKTVVILVVKVQKKAPEKLRSHFNYFFLTKLLSD